MESTDQISNDPNKVLLSNLKYWNIDELFALERAYRCTVENDFNFTLLRRMDVFLKPGKNKFVLYFKRRMAQAYPSYPC